MQRPHAYRRVVKRFFTISLLFASSILVLIVITQNPKSSFAQVTDWCSQPGILWCTSHEEFAIDTNLPRGSNYGAYPYTNDPSWYARATPDTSGGGVDRNDDQYTSWPTVEPIRTALPAKIVAVSTSVPARSGEMTGKKYLELNANTVYADANLKPAYQYSYNTNAGIFLSRKVRASGVNLVNVGSGLYFSAWYRFPQVYESTRPGENNNLMVMEFMNERNNAASWQVPWSIHLQKSNGNMYFRVDERSYNLRQDYTSGNGSLIQHTDSTLAIPINQWVHLEVFYKYGNYTTSESITGGTRGKSSGGQVIVFQDGIEIYRFDNVATTTQAGDGNWVSDRWMVTAYAAADGAANPTPNPQTSPTNFQVLVDDAAISTVRLGGARELISNGDFETLANWRIDDDTLAIDSLESAGMSANSSSAAKLARNIGANPTGLYDPSFYQTVAGGLSKGATYTLRFSAKVATAGRTIQALLLENSYNCCGGSSNDQWTEYWNDSCGVVSLDTALQNYVCTFTAAYASNSVNLVFRLGGNHNTIWLDNVSLVQNDNLLRNGDFSDTTTAPWTFNLNGASASTSIDNNGGLAANNPKAMAITVTAALTDVWKPELYQVIQGGLDKDITYTLRFTGKVNISSRAIRVVVQSNESPYSFLWSGSCGQVTLTSAAQNFVCAVTLPAATTNARLNFLLGGSGSSHTVWIDNVSLSRSQ